MKTRVLELFGIFLWAFLPVLFYSFIKTPSAAAIGSMILILIITKGLVRFSARTCRLAAGFFVLSFYLLGGLTLGVSPESQGWGLFPVFYAVLAFASIEMMEAWSYISTVSILD